jgi:nucleotide-binding universal stress UspA family protein
MNWTIPTSRVLVPFDFSQAARDALAVALELAARPGAIDVVFVMAPPTPPAPGVAWGELDLESMRGQAEHSLASAVREAAGDGCVSHVLIGTPANRLVEFAREHDCDLVVISSHGRRGVERWLMGSVAERVVRFAPCSVLVLRAEQTVGERGA